jgi:hypothetical protein
MDGSTPPAQLSFAIMLHRGPIDCLICIVITLVLWRIGRGHEEDLDQ